ncbi:hypothetical protein vseg_014428 [Gypsophila vaccaria]
MEKRVRLESGFDRISSLPDPIRAHILSYLPSCAAVRTSILSSTWRALWTHMLSLDLSGIKLPALVADGQVSDGRVNDAVMGKKESYYDFLDRAFESILMLERLKLCVPCVGLEMKSRLDSWLGRALGFRLLELEFELGIKSLDEPRYILPNGVFRSNLMTRLTLVNCKVDESSLTGIHLPSLCYLSLVWVYVNEEGISSLVANCPNLEDINLDTCHGSERLEISGLVKLKKAMIKNRYDDPLVVKIEAPSLLEFTYECNNCYDNDEFCKIELIGCVKMKYFKAVGTPLDGSDLYSLLANLPALERLELSYCGGLRFVKIESSNLVHLELLHCQELQKAEIDAPNLKVFHYDNDDLIRFSLRGSVTRLKEASVYLRPDEKNNKWYKGLLTFFANLRHCDRLKLFAGSEEDLIFPQQVRMKSYPPLSGVKHLTVEIRASSLEHNPVHFVEGLLWLAPCSQTISISNDSIPSYKSLEMMYETPFKWKKCGCWRSLPIKCWRHSLNKVSIRNKKGAEGCMELANFFRNARLDGKIVKVECSYDISLSQPQKD